MFDIGFWELVVVGAVALIVLGPERLPVVAREVGRWIGRMRGFVSEVKGDIDREMRLRDIREAIERDAGLDEIKKIINSDRHLIEDEQPQQDYVVKAREDEPIAKPQMEQIEEPEEDYSYGLTDHSDHGLENDDLPAQAENIKIPSPLPPHSTPTQTVGVEPKPTQPSNGSQTKPTQPSNDGSQTKPN